ncbi:MAG: DinB family protein [Oscillospiraceae bacterium]|nr:DinB family protein [Oscillospiraceae bacterium]
MSNVVAFDVQDKFDKSFLTIRGIIEVFPEDKWLVPHGHDFYVPCRLCYHLAIFIDGMLGGGNRNPDFAANLPFGNYSEAKAEDLPNKADFLAYFDGAVERAKAVLAELTDEELTAALPEEQARFGKTRVGMYLHYIRELAAHSGELNKMLDENGLDDVWISR